MAGGAGIEAVGPWIENGGQVMSERVEVSPFFERGETGHDGFPAETYVAGFRCASGTGGGVEITLPAEIVERIVLTGSRLSVSLSPEGRLVLDGEGLSDDVLEAASAAGGLRDQTLESLVSGCLNLDFLGGEEDPVGELTALRGQMVRALAQLDATLDELKKRQAR
jgi:hypothetical protein